MFYRRFSHSTGFSTSYSKACSVVLLSLVSAAACAQKPAPTAPQPPAAFKAPPEVEQALRARVTEFFQFHVEGNFRAAYGMIAEDTKEYYFNTPMGDLTVESF